jgi:hypothetical protein
VRHATPDDLGQAGAVLDALRAQPGLRERNPGYFSRGSRAFLHFHADGDELYADVRLGTAFERLRVTTPEEQSEFLCRVRRSLEAST